MIYSKLSSQSITVYNRYVTDDFGVRDPMDFRPPSATNQVRWDRTVIHNCSWEDDVKVLPDSTGKPQAGKTVSITIPIEAAKRVEMEQGKTYISPQEYTKLPMDNFNHWTIQTGTSDPDIIILGEGPEITAMYDIDRLRQDYRHTSPVQASDSTDQNVLPGWEIVGV